ncbi:MAG: hypothetical protein LBD73_08040 [Deferribacteraceae bacterium]|jgi:hypothetical protein|nr:hypothetical protein [Deferribacteraceae bacterium]
MNKFIGAVVVLALILAGIYFGVRFATASKAKAILAEYLDGVGEWSVDSTYYNPLTQEVVANGFKTILDDETEITIKTAKISGFNQTGDELAGSGKFEDIRIDTDSVELSIKSLSSPKIVFDREALLKFKEDPYSATPLKQLAGFKMEGLNIAASGDSIFSIESIVGEGSYEADGKILPYPAVGNAVIKNIVFYTKDREYRVEKTTSSSAYKDGVYDAKIDMDSQELFALNAAYAVSGLSDAPLSDDAEYLLTLISSETNYTDRSLINVLLDQYIKGSDTSREEAVDQLMLYGALLTERIKNGDIFLENLSSFLKDPRTLTIKTNPAEPVAMDSLNAIDELGLSVSFNGGEPFLIQEGE